MSLVIITLFVVTPLLAIISGVAISVVWHWHMVPLGVPPIETAHAIGLVVLIGLMTYKHPTETAAEAKGEASAAEAVFTRTLTALMTTGLLVLIAWLAQVAK